MARLENLHHLVGGLDAPDLLSLLVGGKFAGRTAVTASLKARSVVVLKMIADIDPATPVIFCHASALYPESRPYRDALVERLGLRDVREAGALRVTQFPGDRDHFECLWADDPSNGGKVREIVHLDPMLSGFDCWISAVYHMPKPPQARHRIDRDGRLVRVDPLIDWTDVRVRDFLAHHDLPLHPRAVRPPVPIRAAAEAVPMYCY